MPGLDDLVIHPSAKVILAKLSQDLPQSLLLSGPQGVGLGTISRQLAGSRLAVLLQPRDSKEQIDNENGSIGVEAIRQLYEQTRAKQTERQVIVIDNADRMSRGAQSAFLKLLEEPGAHSTFILTAHQPDQLLPTIRSRVQHTALRPASSGQTAEFLKTIGVTDQTKRIQLRYIAEGLPAKLSLLHSDNDLFQAHAAIIGDARTFIQGTAYDKAMIAQKYRGDRAGALQLIDGAIVILRKALSAKPQPVHIQQIDRLLEVRECLAANGNVNLQLMRFVL